MVGLPEGKVCLWCAEGAANRHSCVVLPSLQAKQREGKKNDLTATMLGYFGCLSLKPILYIVWIVYDVICCILYVLYMM